jgi:hypothetical protein
MEEEEDDAKTTMTVTTVTPSTSGSSTTTTSLSFSQFQPSKEMFTADEESIASNSAVTFLTGRMPKLMSLSCDVDSMSPYQALLRKQMELFEADCREVQVSIQGRNKPILLGQVGIRCCHCAPVHPMHRTRAAVYFPTKLEGIYQAGQNMSHHMLQYCPNIPSDIRDTLAKYKEEATSTTTTTTSHHHHHHHAGGGKKHWAHTAQVLGVYEDKRNDILRFECLVPDPVALHHDPLEDFELPSASEEMDAT